MGVERAVDRGNGVALDMVKGGGARLVSDDG